MPPTRKTSLPLSISSSALKDTEYQQQYPNYRSFIPVQELLPPHLAAKANTQSDAHNKKEHMSRSQYFHQLIIDNEKFNGGQRIVGTSEHRTAYQWPYHFPQPKQKPQQQQQEVSTTVCQPYSTPKNIYEPLPPIQRTTVNVID
jgi:hypothetical protein